MNQRSQDQLVWQAAQHYLENAWAVFPLSEAKHHLSGESKILSGKFAAKLRYYVKPVTSLSEVTCRVFEGCGVGIATGKVSGLIVVDIDGATGLENAARLKLPRTRTVKTQNGLHLYYAYPPTAKWVPSSPGALAEGIDIKADDGFINAPPSRHPEGGYYQWVDPDAPIASLPPDIVALMLAMPHRPRWKIYRRYIFQKYFRHPFNAITGK